MISPYLIGITGGSGSGKTRFLMALTDRFEEGEVCLVSQDNYYKPRETQPKDAQGVKNFDLPESFDFEAYVNDVKDLRNGKKVFRKEYTYNNPDAVSKTIQMKPAPVIIVEGIFVLFNQEIARMLDLKIFIEAKSHIRLKRRIIRDDEERGYDLQDVLYRYEAHVIPTYVKYIKPIKSDADIIIPNNKDFSMALSVLSEFIGSKLVKSR